DRRGERAGRLAVERPKAMPRLKPERPQNASSILPPETNPKNLGVADARPEQVEIPVQTVVEEEARARIDAHPHAPEDALLGGVLDSQVVILNADAPVISAAAQGEPSFPERMPKLSGEILHPRLAGVTDIAEGRFIKWTQAIRMTLMKLQVELDTS